MVGRRWFVRLGLQRGFFLLLFLLLLFGCYYGYYGSGDWLWGS